MSTFFSGTFIAFRHPYLMCVISQRIVLIEGLYLHLDKTIWRDIWSFVDQRWFLECPIELAMTRVRKRHVSTGLCKDDREACERVEANDRPNAELVLKHSLPPDRVISYLDVTDDL